jgi:hypothetical protein
VSESLANLNHTSVLHRSTIDSQFWAGQYERIVRPPPPNILLDSSRTSLASETPPCRTESRIPKRILVRLSYPENGKFEIARTVDISGHGARVVSKRFWQPNVRLSVQSISGDLYSRARVVHCKALANTSYVIGLELLQPSGDWAKLSEVSRRAGRRPALGPGGYGNKT